MCVCACVRACVCVCVVCYAAAKIQTFLCKIYTLTQCNKGVHAFSLIADDRHTALFVRSSNKILEIATVTSRCGSLGDPFQTRKILRPMAYWWERVPTRRMVFALLLSASSHPVFTYLQEEKHAILISRKRELEKFILQGLWFRFSQNLTTSLC